MFHVTAWKDVTEEDREIEIIAFKRQMQRWLTDRFADEHGILQLGSMSCEMLAKQLFETFGLAECEITEDDENGARVCES